MKPNRRKRLSFYLLITAAVSLIAISVIIMVHTFKHYNELSLQRQDSQLESMAQAADAGMASYMSSFRDELRYVINRRGFLNAEKAWYETGSTEDLLSRMQENLITGNPLIHNMLAIHGDEVILTSADSTDYYFPDGMAGTLKPCFTGDGAMYLAILEDGLYARYAVLISMNDWYAELSQTYSNEEIHLMLLGSQKRILLHTWRERQCVNIMDELTADNCDMQAVRHMIESYNTSQQLTASYALSYPGENYVHEMRMTVLPLTECTNGYFIVGLTSDYDEIILSMQSTAWKLIASGALLVMGVLMLMFVAVMLVHQNRSRDRELEHLVQRNAETQKLLDKTTELAHHQRLETIGTLTASIAHEFNNLLTPIMGYSILTLEELPEGCEDLADNVTEIYEASRKAKDIISRLNALSRKSAETAFTPLSLGSIVEKAMHVAAPAQPPRVKTKLISAENDLIVSGIETQLSQLMLNLILNAYHAMEQSGGTLTLTTAEQDGFAILQVQDEGIGIPPEALPHIFEPFFTTKESGRGTGLGLAIVQQVVENHHGEIKVHSTPNRGSTFNLWLPLAATNEDSIS